MSAEDKTNTDCCIAAYWHLVEESPEIAAITLSSGTLWSMANDIERMITEKPDAMKTAQDAAVFVRMCASIVAREAYMMLSEPTDNKVH